MFSPAFNLIHGLARDPSGLSDLRSGIAHDMNQANRLALKVSQQFPRDLYIRVLRHNVGAVLIEGGVRCLFQGGGRIFCCNDVSDTPGVGVTDGARDN